MNEDKQIMVCIGGVWHAAQFDRWNIGVIVTATGEWRNLGSLDAYSYAGSFSVSGTLAI